MNKVLIALLAGGVIFGGVFALAAGLDVSSQGLASGSASVAGCDTAVTVTYNTDFVGGAYVVDSITISDIAAACDGETVNVTVTDGATPNSFTATANALGSVEIDVGDLDPADITDVFVLIGGTPVTT